MMCNTARARSRDQRARPGRLLTAVTIPVLAAFMSHAYAQEAPRDGLLEKLRDKGVLTQDEYDEIKRERA